MSARILSAPTTMVQLCCSSHVSSYPCVSPDVTLNLDAEMAGLAAPEDTEPAEHVMLHLNDEIAGLIEAADMPAGEAGAHTIKPEPATLVPGKSPVVPFNIIIVLVKGSAVLRKVQVHLVSIQW